MTREEISSKAIEELDNNKCLILELATGVGKTKISIDCANYICDKVYECEEDITTILILVAKTVHKKEWEDQIKSWGGIKSDHIVIECYESLKKYKGAMFDLIICDEAQHLSGSRRDILNTIYVSYNIICLSATFPKVVKQFLHKKYKTYTIKTSLQDAIDATILPDPVIYLMPLTFDSTQSETIVINQNKSLPIIKSEYAYINKYKYQKNYEAHIKCTKQQYLTWLNNQIEYFKKKSLANNIWASIKWKRLCNDRLIWLSKCKNALLLNLLNYLKNYRTLTFCSTIEQSELLGKNCIHSKNKNSTDILDKFNNKKIKHITSVNILNEGANLTDCRIGILSNINASEIIITQRVGRILRHKKPILIVPYFINTREQEILKKHLENYNKNLIKVLRNFKDIQL